MAATLIGSCEKVEHSAKVARDDVDAQTNVFQYVSAI